MTEIHGNVDIAGLGGGFGVKIDPKGAPVILPPCYHWVVPYSTYELKHAVVTFHGKENGESKVTVRRIDKIKSEDDID